MSKSRIQYRLRDIDWEAQEDPMFRASNIHYKLSDRTRRSGLIEALDRYVEVLKVHLPYHESDHVLNLAYNVLAGGTCMEDIELRRNNEVYLDALGTQRIPDPTTEGDFLRRFGRFDIESLMTAINETRLGVWRRAGFRKIKFRGDTDSSQCEHLDRWDSAGVQFVFGFDSQPNLVGLADSLAEQVWEPLERRAKYAVRTEPRERPVNVKEAVVIEREFENIRLGSEDVAEFDYSPVFAP